MSDFSTRPRLDSIGRPQFSRTQNMSPVRMMAFSGSLPYFLVSDFQPSLFRQAVSHLEKQPFLAHFLELRNRIFRFLGSVLLGSIGAYFFQDEIVSFVTAPLQQTLFYSSPGGGFDFLIKLCIFSGVLLSVPVFIYQLLRFLEPLLTRKSWTFIVATLFFSTLLLLLGVGFAYLVAIPLAIGFLNDFSTEQVQSLILTSEYLSFMMSYLIGFGLAFQFPLILLIINSVHPFKKGQLWRNQKWVILVSFIIAAIVTPTPDIFNMLIMAVPLIFLYQVSIFLVWWKNRKKTEKKKSLKSRPSFDFSCEIL